MNLICYQCEQGALGCECRETELCCGKEVSCAHLQNLLLAWCKQIASLAVTMRQLGNSSSIVDRFFVDALYATSSNVNFDQQNIAAKIQLAYRIQQLTEYLASNSNTEYQASLEKDVLAPLELFSQQELDELIAQGPAYACGFRQKESNPFVVGFQELILSGLKGTAANVLLYQPLLNRFLSSKEGDIAELKAELGRIKSDSKNKVKRQALQSNIDQEQQALNARREDVRTVYDGIFEILAFLGTEPSDSDQLLEQALKAGRINRVSQEILEQVRNLRFGDPQPSVVRHSPVPGKCILVAGNCYSDLYDLLEQTEFSNINVYTYDEMLSASACPQLKVFKHFCGHYGGSWHQQQKDFDGFPGAILMTTGKILKPEESYKDYIFTTGPVYLPGVARIEQDTSGKKDFLPLIQAAKDSPGFFRSRSNDKLTIGYDANAVISLFDQVRKAYQQKQFRGFQLIAGSDGPGESRHSFTELASNAPADAIILTFGSLRNRLNDLSLAPLETGLPRFFDLGQISEAAGAIRLFKTFCAEFGFGMDNIPLSIYFSWYDSASIAVLLSFLEAGFRGIHLGPTIPAFMTQELLDLFAQKFDLKRMTNADETL